MDISTKSKTYKNNFTVYNTDSDMLRNMALMVDMLRDMSLVMNMLQDTTLIMDNLSGIPRRWRRVAALMTGTLQDMTRMVDELRHLTSVLYILRNGGCFVKNPYIMTYHVNARYLTEWWMFCTKSM